MFLFFFFVLLDYFNIQIDIFINLKIHGMKFSYVQAGRKLIADLFDKEFGRIERFREVMNFNKIMR
jgi:hypothetical protein